MMSVRTAEKGYKVMAGILMNGTRAQTKNASLMGGDHTEKKLEMTDTKKEGTPRKRWGEICAECYYFTKKGDKRNCENEDSDHYGKPVDSTQRCCNCFEAYWW